ncbi:unnamed protein product [Mytilus coruscus]|uniref:Uncharacterized protein n=1 Tax=Mytilus coruscus TaxID=42192 RepID=A0A6J8EEM8_MYTCO|nr:unnamed protein product [Mytilus coruscus]
MEEYKDYLAFCDVEPLEILKHVSTRWLSLQTCITVMKLVDTFPNLLNSKETLQLQEEFTDYQLTPLEELPKCPSPETDIATFWGEMSNLHVIFFSNKVMKLVDTFRNLLNSEETLQLQEEFTDYQLTPLEELPKCPSPETDIATFLGKMFNLHDILFQIELGLLFYQN